MNRMMRGAIVVGLAAVLWWLPVPVGLTVQAWHLFAIFAATILGFILQPMPLGAVALAGVTFSALLGILKPGEALAGFSDTTIWLIVSAFLFAKGFIKTGLGRRIAYVLILWFGSSSLKLAYTLVLSDFIISPATPSNTARSGGILFPIVRSLASAFGSEPGPTRPEDRCIPAGDILSGGCTDWGCFPYGLCTESTDGDVGETDG